MSCKYPLMWFAALCCLAARHLPAQQSVDPGFDSTVHSPAYRISHPRVVIDQAHFNMHTADGLYRPLAELLRHDGYEVDAGTETFSAATLGSLQVLIIANARGGAGGSATVGSPAFTDAECDAVRDWVRRGGALLLIADHVPFGAAAAALADRFGVSMGLGHVIDARHSVIDPTLLVYSRANGLLGEHPVLSGRNAGERVRRVVAFDGQSLSVPRGATVLMQLARSAWEVGVPAELDAAVDAVTQGHRLQAVAPSATPVGGRAQGIALSFGEGRLIIVGEAAMFSAQILKQAGEPDFKFGMNRPGNDDRQFALNALHWLSRAD